MASNAPLFFSWIYLCLQLFCFLFSCLLPSCDAQVFWLEWLTPVTGCLPCLLPPPSLCSFFYINNNKRSKYVMNERDATVSVETSSATAPLALHQPGPGLLHGTGASLWSKIRGTQVHDTLTLENNSYYWHSDRAARYLCTRHGGRWEQLMAIN